MLSFLSINTTCILFWVRLKYATTSVIIDIYCALNILITPFANFEIPSYKYQDL